MDLVYQIVLELHLVSVFLNHPGDAVQIGFPQNESIEISIRYEIIF